MSSETTSSPPTQDSATELSASQQKGRTLLLRGTVLYYTASALPLFWAVFAAPFGIALGFVLAGCILWAPVMVWRGSEGWKNFAGTLWLFMTMAAFAGGCGLADPETTHWGAMSLVVFVLGCYVVRVFLINQDVKNYVPALRAAHTLKTHSKIA